jgi:hypothetical protein
MDEVAATTNGMVSFQHKNIKKYLETKMSLIFD